MSWWAAFWTSFVVMCAVTLYVIKKYTNRRDWHSPIAPRCAACEFPLERPSRWKVLGALPLLLAVDLVTIPAFFFRWLQWQVVRGLEWMEFDVEPTHCATCRQWHSEEGVSREEYEAWERENVIDAEFDIEPLRTTVDLPWTASWHRECYVPDIIGDWEAGQFELTGWWES